MSKYINIINEGTVHNLKTIYEQNYVDTVQVVRHGRWESVQYGCICSVCGKRKEQFSDNFCANCGASMMDEVTE